MFNSVKGYDLLTEEQQDLLRKVYEKHMMAFGTEARKKYTTDKIVKVKWDTEDKTVNIYFSDIWWHYAKDGTWY